MTTTFMAVIALAGSMVPAAKPEFEAQTDYGQAVKVAATEKKPMAVLIGKGDVFSKMMADSSLTAEAKKLLKEKYVCMTVNVETDAGKELAKQFQMTEGGLVISSAGGSLQALRHNGAVTAGELSKHTTTYANVSAVPATTVTAGAATPTYYYQQPVYSSCPGGTCPTITTSSCPGGTCPSTVLPAGGYVYPSTPYYYGGSSCPTGRCPNAR